MTSKKLVPADRIKDTEESVWVEFVRLVGEYKPVNLGQGFPDFGVPNYVTEALSNTTLSGAFLNQYTRGFGHPRLVNILGKFYSKLIGHEINPLTEVLVTIGAYQALFCTILGNINPDDEVIIIEPFYDCYDPMVKMAGGKSVYIPLRPKTPGKAMTSDDWILDPDELTSKFNEKTKAIIVNNPNNPIGKVFRNDELELIAGLAKKWDVLVIMDEVYEWITYDSKQHIRLAAMPGMWDRTITIGSAGKTFSVTGWKIGWAYGPRNLISNLQAVHQNNVYTCPTPIQEAVAIGFEKEINRLGSDDSYFSQLPAMLKPRRDEMATFLSESGFHPVVPEGGYFMLADFSQIANKYNFDDGTTNPKDNKFCKWLIKEKKLASIPPTSFYGKQHKLLGENYIRLCFFKNEENMTKAKAIFRKLNET